MACHVTDRILNIIIAVSSFDGAVKQRLYEEQTEAL